MRTSCPISAPFVGGADPVLLGSDSSDNIVIAAALTNTRDLYGAGGIVNEGANNLIIGQGGHGDATAAATPWPVIAVVVGAIVALAAVMMMKRR